MTWTNKRNDMRAKTSVRHKRNFPEIKVLVSEAKSIALICLLFLFDDGNFSKGKYRESYLTNQAIRKEQHVAMLSRITVKVPFLSPQVHVEMNAKQLLPASCAYNQCLQYLQLVCCDREDGMLSSGFLSLFFAFQMLSGYVQWQKEYPHKNNQLL